MSDWVERERINFHPADERGVQHVAGRGPGPQPLVLRLLVQRRGHQVSIPRETVKSSGSLN